MHRNLDIQQEHLVSLKEAAKHLPKRNGKRAHYSTVFRWVTKGARGKKLESVLLGGVRYTSIEALCRFMSPGSSADLEAERMIAQLLASEGV